MKRRFEDLRCWQMAREYRKAVYTLYEQGREVEQIPNGYISHLRAKTPR